MIFVTFGSDSEHPDVHLMIGAVSLGCLPRHGTCHRVGDWRSLRLGQDPLGHMRWWCWWLQAVTSGGRGWKRRRGSLVRLPGLALPPVCLRVFGMGISGTWEEFGFGERLSGGWRRVDLGLRVRRRRWLCVWCWRWLWVGEALWVVWGKGGRVRVGLGRSRQ